MLKKDKSLKDQIKLRERKTMQKLSRLERRGSELDTGEMPETPTESRLSWRAFNCDLYSSTFSLIEVLDVIKENPQKRLDLRPYMIQSPFVCTTTDKIQKVLDIFRFMQLKQMCVINPADGSL